MGPYPTTPRRSPRKLAQPKSLSPSRQASTPTKRSSPRKLKFSSPPRTRRTTQNINKPKPQTACPLHENRLPIPRTHFISLVNKAMEAAESLSTFVPDNYTLTWTAGLLEMDKMMGEGYFRPKDCGFCIIEQFLATNGRLPWLVGLRFRGEDVAYSRTLGCIKALGDDESELDTWVPTLLAKVPAAMFS